MVLYIGKDNNFQKGLEFYGEDPGLRVVQRTSPDTGASVACNSVMEIQGIVLDKTFQKSLYQGIPFCSWLVKEFPFCLIFILADDKDTDPEPWPGIFAKASKGHFFPEDIVELLAEQNSLGYLQKIARRYDQIDYSVAPFPEAEKRLNPFTVIASPTAWKNTLYFSDHADPGRARQRTFRFLARRGGKASDLRASLILRSGPQDTKPQFLALSWPGLSLREHLQHRYLEYHVYRKNRWPKNNMRAQKKIGDGKENLSHMNDDRVRNKWKMIVGPQE